MAQSIRKPLKEGVAKVPVILQMEALDRMNCTRIVIAHRLSTIRHCDRILMVQDGAIIEEGTYEELIRKGGEFADLVARQRLDQSD